MQIYKNTYSSIITHLEASRKKLRYKTQVSAQKQFQHFLREIGNNSLGNKLRNNGSKYIKPFKQKTFMANKSNYQEAKSFVF